MQGEQNLASVTLVGHLILPSSLGAVARQFSSLASLKAILCNTLPHVRDPYLRSMLFVRINRILATQLENSSKLDGDDWTVALEILLPRLGDTEWVMSR